MAIILQNLMKGTKSLELPLPAALRHPLQAFGKLNLVGGPWHLDGIGRQIVSRLNESVLDSLAAATGGAYARYDDPRALEQMTSALQNLEARVQASQPATEPRERYQRPLLLAVLCLLLELWRAASPPLARTGAIPGFASPPAPSQVRAGAAALLLVLPLWSCTGAQRQLAKGQQLYEQGKYLEAYEAYQAVLRQQGGPEIRYNAGNSLYRLRRIWASGSPNLAARVSHSIAAPTLRAAPSPCR